MHLLNNDIKDWVIYKITSPSGRIYIGKTVCLKKRLCSYRGIHCKEQFLIKNSILKYGFDAHKIEVIEEFKGSVLYASGKEIFWIRSYMSNFSKWGKVGNGLNLTDGGEGKIGAKASEETRAKLREAWARDPKRKEAFSQVRPTPEAIKKAQATKKSRVYPKRVPKPVSVETRLKMSIAKKGKPPHNKGKPMPEHQKEILRKANIGRPGSNAGKTFAHLTEEERKLRFGSHNIGNSYNKGRKQRPEVVADRVKRQIGRPLIKKRKPIDQFDRKGVYVSSFASVTDASIALGASESKISAVLNNRRSHTIGWVFKYKIS